MTTILDYIRAMYPVNERKDIIAALIQLQDELTNFTLPILVDVEESLVNHTFKSSLYKELTQQLQKHVRFTSGAHLLVIQAVRQIHQNLPFVEAEIKRAFSFQFTRDNLTYRRVSLMRYVEQMHFYIRYTRKLFLHLIADEARHLGQATPADWPKAERQWLADNLSVFAASFPVANKSQDELKKAFSQVSDATINADTFETAQVSLGNRAMDPLQLSNLSPTSGNPFFSLGKAIAEYKVKSYQAAKEEHQALQLRLQEYRELESEGNTNPKLQKLIQHTEQRVQQLDYRIAKIEEDHRY